MKHLSLLLISMIFSVASFAQITGPYGLCIGTTAIYTDPTPGGTWSCSSTTIATMGSATGLLSAAGAAIITVIYTMPSSAVDTFDVTILPLPCPIGGLGSGSLCTGASTGLSDCMVGGTWSSSSFSTASIDPMTGLLTGGTPGTAIITYTAPTGCYVTSIMVTVNPAPPAIIGAMSVCTGSSTTLADGAAGGTWNSSTEAVATVGSVTGVVFGVSPGTAVISYTLGTTGCAVSATVAVNSLPASHTVTGGGGYCAGGAGVAVGLDGSDPGIAYQLYNGLIPIGAAMTGTGSPLNFGLQTVPGTYTVVASSTITGCTGNMAGSVTVTVGALPVAYTIAGGGAYCAGSSGVDITLGGSDVGVTYQLYLGGSPVGSPIAGTGGPLDFGVVSGTGSYSIEATSVAGCTSAMSGIAVISVSPMPAAYMVTGGGSYCVGGTGVDIGLDASATGISYQLYMGGVAVGLPIAGTGTVIDFGPQTAAGVYTVVATNDVTTCTSNMTGSATVTITPLPTAYSIVGAGGSYCAGGAGADVALSSSDLGVTYALYNGTTLVTSLSGTGAALDFGDQLAGTYTITASGTGTCTSPMTGSFLITVSSLPTITAYTSSVACDGSYTLNAGGGVSYTWAGAGLSCTTCSSPDVNPTASATYTVTGTDGSGCVNTATTSVDGNRISGVISPAVSGTIRVWLVQFNPADSSIAALDSTTTCTSGGTQYYEFADPASGNYMVKAYELGGTPGTSGYIPTYSSSAPHWDAAATVSHTSATDYMNVTMIYGTVPSGPGFIGGYIASGAGKGTSETVPVGGMLVYLTDAANNIITYTYTDGSGNYGFAGLANGSYIIYPEFYQYATTASSVITLSSSAESVSGINFKQHTSNRTISPYDYTAVKALTLNEGIMVYPNPASGNLNIQWQNQPSGVAAIVITDVVGREVYRSALNITAASGQTQVGLDGVKDGVYIITIKGEGINYNGKVVVQN